MFSGLRRRNAISPGDAFFQAVKTQLSESGGGVGDQQDALIHSEASGVTVTDTVTKLIVAVAESPTNIKSDNELDLSDWQTDMDVEEKMTDWENISVEKAHPLESVNKNLVNAQSDKDEQMVQEVITTPADEPGLLAEQFNQSKMQQTEAINISADTVLVLRHPVLPPKKPQNSSILVSLPAVVLTSDNALAQVGPPVPDSTLCCLQLLKTHQSPRASEKLQSTQIPSVDSVKEIQAQSIGAANRLFESGHSPRASFGGFFECFLGLPASTIFDERANENETESAQNIDSNDHANSLARLTYTQW